MDRRAFLRASGLAATAGITTLAGCGNDQELGENTQSPSPTDETDGEAGDATPTEVGGATGTESGDATATGTDGATTTTGAGRQVVSMASSGGEFYFDPIGLFVRSGETVTFRVGSGSHSSTAYQQGTGSASVTRIPQGAAAWNSGTLAEQGATFEHTFETAGTYDYFCIPHKSLGMVGRIVVDEPGGPAEGSMPPDGRVPRSGTIVQQGSVSYGEFRG